MKDLWIEEFERLKDELGREPTSEEVNQALEDRISSLADRLKDEASHDGLKGSDIDE